MESKTVVLVVVIGLAAAGILGGLLTMLKPASVRESEMVTAPTTGSFPSSPAPSRGADEPAAKLAVPDDPGTQQRNTAGMATGGSLDFIRGGGGMSASSAGGPGSSAEASAAAAKGDAKGLIQGLQQDKAGGPAKATRAVMQKVVDAVHQAQPMWYKEFLANKELKAIADTYDKGMDFGSFLRQLAKSPAFKGMLKRRANTTALRGLTKNLLDDPETGPQLSQLFMQNAKDPDVIGTVREFGAGAGLPTQLLEFVGAAPKPFVKPQLNTSRPAFKPSGGFGSGGFGSNGGGFGSRSSFGGQQQQQQQQGDQPQMPAGVDPQMLQQYQKYMQK